MDRLFLDANVLFSAAWRPDSRIRLLWTLADVELVTSTQAVEEAVRNLVAEKPSCLAELDQLVDGMRVVACLSITPESLPEVRLPQDDLCILCAAIQAGATHLITGDRRHFGQLMGAAIGGISVMPPANYLAMRGAA